VPANADALIAGVKSLYGASDIDIVKAVDAEARREHGIPDPEIPEPPIAQNKLRLNGVPIASITKGEKVTISPVEIPAPPTEAAAPGKKTVVVKLDATSAPAQPFVIRSIKRTRS
jgi:hypothetical protein